MEHVLCDLSTFPVHRSQRPAAQLGTCGSTGLYALCHFQVKLCRDEASARALRSGLSCRCAIGPDCTVRKLNMRVGEVISSAKMCLLLHAH